MKKFNILWAEMPTIFIICFIFFCIWIDPSLAQGPQSICYTTNGQNCIKVSPTNPLPTTATLSGSVTVTFPTIGAAVPSTAIYNALNVSGTLRGMTGLSLGSTFSQTVAIVDGSGNQITNFGSSSAVGSTGAAVPASANYIGINVGGILTGWNGAVTVTNTNSNGQATMANSSPVVIASNQSSLSIVGTGTFVTQATPTATATGGATQTSFVAANSNNATSLKASAGTVYSVQLAGIGSAPAYLKFYDKASAPTCQSDTIVSQFIIPAASTAANGAGSNVSIPVGKNFATGIAYCVVTGIAANDNTSVAAATYVVNIDYK